MTGVLAKTKRYFAGILAGVVLTAVFGAETKVSAAPIWPETPETKAKSMVLMEASTGSVLWEKKGEDAMFPASTTKLMTALLAIENCELNETVTMFHDAVYSMGWDASRVGMNEGETLSMEDSLYAVLLASANEVCYAVAEHTAGGNIDAFIRMMNDRAKELGCVNSHFVNPHGLHDPEHYTCAYDLALIMKACLEYPVFSEISNHHYYTLPATNKSEARDIPQTHKILRKRIECEGVFAGKTGYTDEAGYCLVTAAERNGMTLICVVMGESKDEDCYTDTIALFDRGFKSFEKKELTSGERVTNAFPMLFDDSEAFLKKGGSRLSVSTASLVLPVGAELSDVTSKSTLTQLLEIQMGDNVIGETVFYYLDLVVGKADIVYRSDSYEITDIAELYLREYKDTEDFDEKQYRILAGTWVEEEDERPDYRPRIIGYSVACAMLLAGVIVLIKMYIGKNRK